MAQKIKIIGLTIAVFFVQLIATNAQNTPIEIGKAIKLFSRELSENRKINIYLPEDYNPKDSARYPVVYILDGGMEEDFVHLVGLARFNSQPWIDHMPKAIVVGIENVNRRRDFTFAVSNTDFIEKEGFKKSSFPQYGNSEKYIDFIEKELQPFLQKNYHVNNEKTIIGESLAGLLATEILLKRPQLFTHYIIISPSLWWGEESLLKNTESLLNKNLKKQVHIYVGAPNKDEDLKMYQEVESLFQKIKSNKNIDATFDYLPQETHATVIHQAVYNAFKTLYPKDSVSK